jgi:hypothetical protein
MNERIKELAQQAGYEVDMFGIGHWDMPECKKFAELIVRRCIAQVALVGLTNFEDDPTSRVCMEAIESIQQHFEVK